jgi:DNA-binding transcriptional LysR family regulator
MMIKPGASGPQEGHFDLRGLRLFLTVAEARSMTEAAKRAGTSQSAVSQAMARLEVNCGAALFERGARPLRLTPAGEVLAKGVPALLRAEAELRRRLAGERDTAAEALRLGLVDSFAATVGPELIRRLRGHSERITVLSGISPTLWADMQDRRLDFMVLTDPAGRIDGMRQHTILSEPYVLLLPKRLADNIEIPSLKDLAATHPFIRYSIRSHIGTQVEEHLARQGISPRASMEFDGTDALFAMVSAMLRAWAGPGGRPGGAAAARKGFFPKFLHGRGAGRAGGGGSTDRRTCARCREGTDRNGDRAVAALGGAGDEGL